ncbi:hypothetical protein [Rhodoferax mekongensis]|uniref:Uncharacterized protein n=1 Tax=Rhodoferax mekongensis TaxID=3068341 RepID=A0ABZ0AZD2_9BURK|nr:hypothetical protein [Rhodoferax sp. TBRC 17307]WNO05023.1 hypothetical protein RAN89_00950 [Rhodoferax sp. TBRC 17307]
MDWIWWSLGTVFVLSLGAYLYAELQAFWLRTTVSKIPGGQRFEAHGFSVDMLKGAGKVRVKARKAHYSQKANDKQTAMEKTGPLDVTFDALGLRIELSRMVRTINNPKPGQDPTLPTGWHSMAFQATEEDAVLRLDHVPTKVADQFIGFAKQIQVWVERLEHQRTARLEAEEAAKREAEEAAAIRAAAKAKGKAVAMPPEEQIAQWRRVAGFTGTNSEIGLDGKGGIEWFIDLDATGRITLHSGKQTAHTTLRGATITSLGGELEINVLDADGNQDPHSFRVLKNMPPDVRRAWKERLEMLRDSLKRSSAVTT